MPKATADTSNSITIRYKPDAPRDMVVVKDIFTDCGEVTFARGETKTFRVAEWLLRLIRSAEILGPTGQPAWTDQDRADCDFEEVI